MWTLRLNVYARDIGNMSTFSSSIAAGHNTASIHRSGRPIKARAYSETIGDQRTVKAEFVSGVADSVVDVFGAAANHELASQCDSNLDRNVWSIFGSALHGSGVCRYLTLENTAKSGPQIV